MADTIIVDGKGHLMGRLASVLAKQALAGKKIVVVRCEEILISGSLTRNKTKYAQFKDKRMNTNPSKGPYHFRSPARLLWRTVRGMIPHMTARGQLALQRIGTYEGIPEPYDKMKRLIIPEAYKAIRMRPDRPYTVLGRLAKEVGWGYTDLVNRLETARKAKEQEFYTAKKAKIAKTAKAAAKADLSKVKPVLASFGYSA